MLKIASKKMEEFVLGKHSIFSEECFENHLNLHNFPEWIRGIKLQAWERFQSTSLPSEKNPYWRFSNPNKLNLSIEQLPSELPFLPYSHYPRPTAGKIILNGSNVVEWQSIHEDLKRQGVIWAPLKKAINKYPDILDRYLFKNVDSLGSENLTYLNTAYCENGAILYVPENVEILMPFLFQQYLINNISFLHVLIVLEKNAKAEMLDFYTGEGAHISSEIRVFLGESAVLKRKTLQNSDMQSTLLRIESQELQSQSIYENFFLDLGGKYSRNENIITFKGDLSSSSTYGITISDKTQFFDQRFLQLHKKSRSKSKVMFKNIANDESKTISHCKIKILPESKNVDAQQRNYNLILSNNSIVHSMPELEIESNEVQCSHGSTTGYLDNDQLFYLTSRGIDDLTAKNLLIQGFCNDALQRFCDQEIIEFWSQLIHKKLSNDYVN